MLTRICCDSEKNGKCHCKCSELAAPKQARTLKMVWGAAKQSFDLLPKVEGNDPKVKAVSILR